jgi:hypothetical protein
MRIVIVMVATLLIAVSYSDMPGSTRTGSVETILIAESLPEADVSVQPGDEVNERGGPIKITFLSCLEGKVSCRGGFGSLDIINATTIKSQESVSLCFSEPGPLHYTLLV